MGTNSVGLVWILSLSIYVTIDQCQSDSRRPIWNLGHMVNKKYQVDDFLNAGANGIEADVTFDKYGIAEFTYHGFPCDCFRTCWKSEKFSEYLQYVHDLSTPGYPKYRQRFLLLFLDLKISGLSSLLRKVAVRDVTTKLIDHLWKGGISKNELKVVLNFPSSDDIELVHTVFQTIEKRNLPKLKERMGFEVYSFENLSKIRQKWLSLNLPMVNIWQSDGITNCLARSTSRLREAISWRDDLKMTFMSKVYYWTVDKKSSIRSTLRLGVDAILTNYPDRVSAILEESEFRSVVRLATANDSPFIRFNATYMTQALLDGSPVPEMIENSDPEEEYEIGFD